MWATEGRALLAGILAVVTIACSPSEAERDALKQQVAMTMGMWMQRDFPGLKRSTWSETSRPGSRSEDFESEYSYLEQTYGRPVRYNIVDVSPATPLSHLPFTRLATWSVIVDMTAERGTYRLGLNYITLANGKTYLIVIGQPGAGSGRG